MKLKILVTGENGQVGSDLAVLLPSVGDVIALDRSQLDLTKPDEIRRTIQNVHPHLIVNVAAYTAVDQAESDEATAFAVNAQAPGVIAEAAKEIGSALIHFSTDYVFDGSAKAPYCESDPPHPINVYGKSKLAGELAIQASGVPHLILRTAWVYATRGKNFLLTILRLASQREELRIVGDQIGAPTCSREIARATMSIIERLSKTGETAPSFSQASGTYHVTAGGVAPRCDFAEAILEEAGKAPPSLHGWSRQ
jgi:dTDP-4-dehydrorhamnose reductase